MNVIFLKKLNFLHFKQMMQLEREFYSEEYIAPAEEAYNWYRKYPFTTVAASNGSKVVGFVNMFPVKEEVFESLKAGNFNDKNLHINDIESLNSSSLNMFLSCIVVKKEYRKIGLTKKLLQQAVKQYKDVEDRCNWIIIDNVTEEGARFSEKYGFSFVRHSFHGSNIYMQPYKKFIEHLI